jgi:hypothetical protein
MLSGLYYIKYWCMFRGVFYRKPLMDYGNASFSLIQSQLITRRYVPLYAGMARRAKGIFLLTVVMISLISATKEAPAVTFRAPRVNGLWECVFQSTINGL